MRSPDCRERIAALEAQLETAQRELSEAQGSKFYELWKSLGFRSSYGREFAEQALWEIERLKRDLDEARKLVQWTPITDDDVPKVGDEVYSMYDGDFLHVHSCDLGEGGEWTREGWTHYRPINAPQEDN